MIELVNRAGFQLTSWIMAPFEKTSPWVGIFVFSLLTAVAALLAYKFCSNQRVLKRRKGAAVGRLLEIRLYQDDLLGIFGTLGRLGGATSLYLFESFKPVAILLIPVLLLLFQLSCWYQFRPFDVQEGALVKVEFEDGKAIDPAELRLESSAGISIETDLFQSRDGREALWRIRGHAPDPEGWVELASREEILRKSVSVAPAELTPISQRRLRDGLFGRLMYPKERGIPKTSTVQSIKLSYANATLYMGSREINWIVALFILSIAFGLLLQKPFRVEF